MPTACESCICDSVCNAAPAPVPAWVHTGECDIRALGMAVQNMRDSIRSDRDRTTPGQYRDIPGDQMIDTLQDWANAFRANGDITCSCAADRIRAISTELTRLRKAARNSAHSTAHAAHIGHQITELTERRTAIRNLIGA